MGQFEQGVVVGVLRIAGTYTNLEKRPTLQVKSRDRSILVVLRDEIGGVIYGPYSGRWVWMLRGKELEAAVGGLAEQLPYLR